MLAGQGKRADLAELATGAVRLALHARVVGEVFDQVEELGAAVLGDGPLQHRTEGRDVGLGDPQPLQGAVRGLVDRDRVAAERLLDDGGRDVVGREGVVGLEDLEGFLERLLGQRVEGEAVGPVEELAEEPADALGPRLGLGNAGQALLDLVDDC